jgi:RNA polymerase sigma-70 factor, ECF subfamily
MPAAAADSAETRRLLEQSRAGDRAAFDELFARHRPFLRQVVDLRLDDRLRARVDPSDIVQETHLVAFRRLENYLDRKPMPFRLWLRRTACDQLLMAERRHLRSKRRSVRREVSLSAGSSLHLADQFLAVGSTPSQQLRQRELAAKMEQLMAELSPADREILIMRNLEQLKNHEVALALEIDPATASQRYGRALLRLRRLLIDHGILELEP